MFWALLVWLSAILGAAGPAWIWLELALGGAMALAWFGAMVAGVLAWFGTMVAGVLAWFGAMFGALLVAFGALFVTLLASF